MKPQDKRTHTRSVQLQQGPKQWLNKSEAMRQLAAKSLGKSHKKARISLPSTHAFHLEMTSTPVNITATKQTSITKFFSINQDAAKTDVQSEASADLPHVLKSGNTPVEYSSGIYEDTKQAEDFEIQYAQQSTSQSDLLLQNDNFYSASPQSEDSSITLSHTANLCDKSQISETRTDNLSNKSPRRNNQIETPYSVASQRDLRPTTNSLHQSQRFYSSTSTLVSHDHSSQSKDLFASADDWELDVKQASEDTLSEKPYDLLASQDLIPSPQLASQGQALSSQGQALSSQNTEDLISSGSISGSQRLRIFEQELKQISKKSGTGSAIDFC